MFLLSRIPAHILQHTGPSHSAPAPWGVKWMPPISAEMQTGIFFIPSQLLLFSVTIPKAFNISEIKEATVEKQQVCMGGKALK